MKRSELAAMTHYYKLTRKSRPDIPALTAWNNARRTIHFNATLSADVAAHKRRSKAAKRAWKVRKELAR